MLKAPSPTHVPETNAVGPSARAAHPHVRKAAPAVRRIVDDAQRKPKLYVDRVVIHGEGE